MVRMETRTLPVYEAGAIDVPFVIAGMDEFISCDTRFEAHSHPTHELLWNERGASSATVGTRTWTITPAIGLWMPAGLLHSGITPAGTWYRTAHFGINTAPALSERPVSIEITPLLRLLLDRLTDESLGSESRALTEKMVIDVLAPPDQELLVQMPTAALLRPIVEAVGANPGDPRTLEDWATVLGVSARTITRAFRSETGMSFGRWTASVRTQRAAILLGAGLELAEVAQRMGYQSVSAFGAAFRRVMGATPATFRSTR